MLNLKSSSIHSLNSDAGLSKWGRRIWFFFNQLNNSFLPKWKSSQLNTRQFSPDLSEPAWKQVELKSSPSRALSDLFWMQLPWKKIHKSLGEIHILDTGCGSGRYGLEIQKFSGGAISSYTGIDESTRPNWQTTMDENKFVNLIAADSANLMDLIPERTNLFMSQSAIEHFPEDLTYFRKISDFLRNKTNPWIQIHLFPSAACLQLYRFHGVRQYVPRTVSLISSLFNEHTATLHYLGGPNCNRLHLDFISTPIFVLGKQDRRESDPDTYRKRLKEAIAKDNVLTNSPSFYALIITNAIELMSNA